MKISGKITYILLTSALVACVGGMGFLGYNMFIKDNSVKMQNFENATKADVLKWVTKNKLEDYVKYEYDYSDTVEEGNVISQSLNENEKVEDNFTITISKGSIIKLNINDYKTKADFDSFISKYPKVKVTYEDGDSENKTNELLKFSKDSIDIKTDQLTVYLSNASNSKDNNKDDDNKDTKTGTKATIPNNLLGIEESKFIKTLNDLGFINLKKNETKYYSFTSKKDTIFSYDDGNYDIGRTINYALSLGDYPTAFDAKEYNGQTLDSANKLVKKYNDLNAHITLKTTNVQTTDLKLTGKLADCKCVKNATNSNLTCNLYTSPSSTIKVDSYAGQNENTMLNALKEKGLTKFSKASSIYSTYPSGTIARNTTGNVTKNDTITYYISLGKYEPNLEEFKGISLDSANNKVKQYNNLEANITFNTNSEEIYDNQNKNNTISSCTSTNNGNKVTLTCTVLKYVQTYSLLSKQIYMQSHVGNSYAETVNKMKNALSDFTNVTFNGVTSQDKGVGQILDIQVDGKDPDISKKYKPNVHIVVTIVETQPN